MPGAHPRALHWYRVGLSILILSSSSDWNMQRSLRTAAFNQWVGPSLPSPRSHQTRSPLWKELRQLPASSWRRRLGIWVASTSKELETNLLESFVAEPPPLSPLPTRWANSAASRWRCLPRLAANPTSRGAALLKGLFEIINF